MANERTQRIVRTSAILSTLLLTALLLAQGTTQMLAAAVLPLAPAEPTPRVRRPSALSAESTEPSARDLGMSILERNIFDSQTGAITWDPPVVETPAEELTPDGTEGPIEDPTGEPKPCESSLKLVAAMVVPRVPMLSFASIQASGKTLLYRPGMQIESHEVVGIREQRVFLRPSGRQICQIAMFVPPTGEGPPPSETPNDVEMPPPMAERRTRSGLGEDELDEGITKVSDTNYSVSRTLLDKVLSNQAELMRAARVIPYEENGRVTGVKVYGIRRSGLLGKLGIQNGDVLRTINGFDLSSPDSALEAYTKLREMDQFSIAMVRRGQPRTMEYSVK